LLSPPAEGVVSSEGGKIVAFAQQEGQYYWRVFSDKGSGGWLTATRPRSAAWAREALALPPGNNADYIQRVFVPAETGLQRSRALPVFGHRGGGEQFRLLQHLPDDNFGPGVPFK
jgi:hypothetical protein